MPPSGYSKNQSELIVGFLISCSDLLIQEAKEQSISPITALQKEISNIKLCLENNNSQFQSIILNLTKLFYEKLLANKPKDFQDLKIIRENICNSFSIEISQIHVPSNFKKKLIG